MTEYNLFADLFDTYQSLPDWLKVMWLIVPPGFVLWLTLLIRTNPSRKKDALTHQHVCSVFVDDKGTIRLYAGDDLFHPVAQLKDAREPTEQDEDLEKSTSTH